MKFLSQIITAASGSVGGATWSRNAAGMYIRARATPVNPNTSRQSAVRAAMSSMVVYWHSTLTAAERAAWDTYAANTPLTDPLGQQQTVSGQNMFLRSNILRQWRSLGVIDAAPTDFDLGQPVVSVTSVVVAAGTLTWTYTVGGAGTDTTGDKFLYIGVAQNAGRNFFKGPYQLAGVKEFVAAATAFSVDQVLATGTDWLAAYQPSVGDLLPIKIRNVYDDGRVSSEYSQLITVT
jgi:hypothetical protein